jgi:LIM domain kinase 1
MSPEIALGEDFGTASDIFSFGIVLCEMITGREPSASFLKRMARDLFALPEEELRGNVLPGCPDSFEALTLQCCAQHPDDRISAPEIADWLQVSRALKFRHYLSSCATFFLLLF